jgi:hypothetical protein
MAAAIRMMANTMASGAPVNTWSLRSIKAPVTRATEMAIFHDALREGLKKPTGVSENQKGIRINAPSLFAAALCIRGRPDER